jgi:Zn-dependent peptidase ImmA (M78 family)
MTNKEWVDLLQKEFNVSRTVAKEMLHGLMTVKQHDNFIRQFQPLNQNRLSKLVR